MCASYYSQIEPSCSKTDRQVTLRSQTTFLWSFRDLGNVRSLAPNTPPGTGACRPQCGKQAGGASEIARSAACGTTMRVSRGPRPLLRLRAYGSFLSEISIIRFRRHLLLRIKCTQQFYATQEKGDGHPAQRGSGPWCHAIISVKTDMSMERQNRRPLFPGNDEMRSSAVPIPSGSRERPSRHDN